MGPLRRDLRDWKGADLIERQCPISGQTPVLWRNLAGLVRELPRRVCENRRKLPFAGKSEKVESHAIDRVRKHGQRLHYGTEQIKNIHRQ
jgi:hypothetical protein